MREIAALLWWMVLYPLAAAIAALAGLATHYLVVSVMMFADAAAAPYLRLASVLLPCYVVASVFVRVSGGLAPVAKPGAASAACGIVLIGALLGWNRLHTPAAWAVIAPLALGALTGLARTHSAERTRNRTAAPPPTGQTTGPRA